MATISTTTAVTEVVIQLPPDQAGQLYDNISTLLDSAEIFGVSSRYRLDVPMVYALFDLLYRIGANSVIAPTEPYSLPE